MLSNLSPGSLFPSPLLPLSAEKVSLLQPERPRPRPQPGGDPAAQQSLPRSAQLGTDPATLVTPPATLHSRHTTDSPQQAVDTAGGTPERLHRAHSLTRPPPPGCPPGALFSLSCDAAFLHSLAHPSSSVPRTGHKSVTAATTSPRRAHLGGGGPLFISHPSPHAVYSGGRDSTFLVTWGS